jgi:hypothetical protein
MTAPFKEDISRYDQKLELILRTCASLPKRAITDFDARHFTPPASVSPAFITTATKEELLFQSRSRLDACWRGSKSASRRSTIRLKSFAYLSTTIFRSLPQTWQR